MQFGLEYKQSSLGQRWTSPTSRLPEISWSPAFSHTAVLVNNIIITHRLTAYQVYEVGQAHQRGRNNARERVRVKLPHQPPTGRAQGIKQYGRNYGVCNMWVKIDCNCVSGRSVTCNVMVLQLHMGPLYHHFYHTWMIWPHAHIYLCVIVEGSVYASQ